MSFITKTCLHCNTNFEASLKEHNRGNAKFCSLVCSSTYYQAHKPKPTLNLTCAYCEKAFHRSTSKQKNSKTGFQFCSRECKDNAQRIENFDTFSAMMPDHFGTSTVGRSNYRDIAFRHKSMLCEECGYNKIPEVLQVHHIDRNRLNCDISNLQILCPTCHQEEHFLNNDGMWGKRKTDDVSEVYDSV